MFSLIIKAILAESHLSDKGIKYTINSQTIAIGRLLEAQYRDLRRGYSNSGLVVPPGVKRSRLHVPNRIGFSARKP